MPSGSIVLELQSLASGSDASVTEVLRKSLVVATKLKIADFKKWIELELNGYDSAGAVIPDYRRITGEVKAFNPYRGYIPAIFEDASLARRLSTAAVMNAIAELEEMATNGKGLVVNYPPETLNILMRGTTESSAMVPRLFIPSNAVTGILSVVRTTILQWALRLEEEGIVGEGMTFSQSEQTKAAASTSIHIQNFRGILGDISTQSLQLGDYNSIAAQLEDAGVPQEEQIELKNILSELPKAVGEQKHSILQRGLDWVARNGEALGSLNKIIRAWFS